MKTEKHTDASKNVFQNFFQQFYAVLQSFKVAQTGNLTTVLPGPNQAVLFNKK